MRWWSRNAYDPEADREAPVKQAMAWKHFGGALERAFDKLLDDEDGETPSIKDTIALLDAACSSGTDEQNPLASETCFFSECVS